MRVLVVAPADPSGSLYWLCKALRTSGRAQARLVTLRESAPPPFGPPADLQRLHDGGEELRSLIEHADVLHLVDLHPSEMPLTENIRGRRQPPRWVLHHAQAPRSHARALSQLAEQTGTPLLSHEPGIPGAIFIPPFFPHPRPPWLPLIEGTRARVRSSTVVAFASCPRTLAALPRLEALVDAAEAIAQASSANGLPCRIEVVSELPPRQVAQRRRRAHLTLCDAEGQMPIEALESWAQGIPVVAGIDPAVRRAYELHTGAAVPLHDPSELASLLTQLDPLADPDPALVAWARLASSVSLWVERCARCYADAPPIALVA